MKHFLSNISQWKFAVPTNYSTIGSAKTLVDLGCYNGVMLPFFFGLNSKIEVTLFDKKEPIDGIKENDLKGYPREQIKLVGGDLFDVKTIPIGQDLYFIKNVFHEFEDDKVIEILKNIRQAIGSHKSKLIIAEWLPEDGKDEIGLGYDIWVMRFGKGIIRSPDMFEPLLKASGFRSSSLVLSNLPQLFKLLEADPC